MVTLTIGQLAKTLSISTDTIRLYERQGLIAEPPRSDNGYRHYPSNTIARLRFIQRAKTMGFTLKQIGELLAIQRTSQHTCDEVRQQAQHKLLDIEHKLNELQRLKAALEMLVHTCETPHAEDVCPLLQALEAQESDI